MKLLLVDDDEVFSGVLARALTRRGFEVVTAHSATAAMLAVDEQVERIVLDLNLGGDSGLKLLPLLRQKCPDSPVLVLTGYASIATAVEATKLGAVQYLAKPASVDEILQAFSSIAPNPELALTARPMSLRRMSWEHVQRVLAEHHGNVSATARALNMHRRTLQRMLSKRPVSA
jgi:two-component system response regulator RegA